MSSLTPSEISLYRELYDTMLVSIRGNQSRPLICTKNSIRVKIQKIKKKGKDKFYKIKKVILTEDNIIVNETDLDSEDSKSKIEPRSYKNRNRLLNDLSLSDFEDSNESTDKNKFKKKKKAVSEYKQAINNIGSKSTTCGSVASFGKKTVDKVIVNESDYSLNDKWLINDIGKAANTCNKRKYSTSLEDDDEDFKDFGKNKKIKLTSRVVAIMCL